MRAPCSLYRYRDLDRTGVEPTDTVDVSSPVDDAQLSLFDQIVTDTGTRTFREVDNPQTQQDLYAAYLKTFGPARQRQTSEADDSQISLFDLPEAQPAIPAEPAQPVPAPADTGTAGNKPMTKEEFVQKIREYSGRAISVPKILVQTTSEVKFNRFEVRRTIPDFEVAMAKIERFDAVNQQFLASVDAQILEVDDALNTLACMLLDSIPELSYDDADFIIDVVDQYLSQIDGDEEEKRRIVRRYATL